MLGTRAVAEAAFNGCRSVHSDSTDKAVNPSSVMGATKRIADHVMREFIRLQPHQVYRRAVRQRAGEQRQRGPAVSRPNPSRWSDHCHSSGDQTLFHAIPEAVQLVLHASSSVEAGMYVLDMGEQIKVVDLARNIIDLAGFVPEKDIPIIFIGLRPGEKLYEELFEEREHVEPTTHPKIRRAIGAPVSMGELSDWLQSLQFNLPET